MDGIIKLERFVFFSILSFVFLTSFALSMENNEVDNSLVLRDINWTAEVDYCDTLSLEDMTYILTQDIVTTGSCFLITGDNITLDGNGHKITGDNGTVDVAVFIAANNVTVKNFEIVNIGGSEGAIYVRIKGSKIMNNYIHDTQGLGILMEHSDNNQVVGNVINNAFGGIYFEHEGRNNVISGNSISNVNVGIDSLGGIAYNNLLENNTLENTYEVGIDAGGFDSSIFRNGMINNSFGNALIGGSRDVFDNIKIVNTDSSAYDFELFGGIDVKLINMNVNKYKLWDFLGSPTIFNLVIRNQFGEIKFLQPVNGSGTNLTEAIQVKDNSISLKVGQNPGFNKPAQITLYNIGNRGFVNPAIKRNLVNCPSNVCMALTPLDAQNVVFNVTGFAYPTTTYRIGDGNRVFGPNINPIGCYSKNGTCPETY